MDISFVLPGIRTHKWIQLVESIGQSCRKYSWEVIIASPFDPPIELTNYKNVKCIKTYACPSTALQMASNEATGELFFSTVDDAVFLPESVDKAIDLFNSLQDDKTIINMRYTEGHNYSGQAMPDAYWTVKYHTALHLPGIPMDYKISMMPMMKRKLNLFLGGLDCGYEYPNFNTHDLLFRAQYYGCQIHQSPTAISNCDHLDTTWKTKESMEHAPIEAAFQDDYLRFQNKYQNPNALNQQTIQIQFDNFKDHCEIWKRRFPKDTPNTYQEMINGTINGSASN